MVVVCVRRYHDGSNLLSCVCRVDVKILELFVNCDFYMKL